jgi:hypothetical protein
LLPVAREWRGPIEQSCDCEEPGRRIKETPGVTPDVIVNDAIGKRILHQAAVNI